MRLATPLVVLLCCTATAVGQQQQKQQQQQGQQSSAARQRALAEVWLYERFREISTLLLAPSNRARNFERVRRLNAMQPEVPSDRPFPCDTRLGRSPSPPDSVHRLRPGDIDVIAALGDSLTAGNGNAASNLLHVAVENKGLSWTIGGEGSWRRFLTLPNILKEFNPRLVGFSLHDALSHQKASQFNVAEGGAMSRDVPFQARLLVRRMRAHPAVDFDRHWKLVTVMVGDNDFCLDVCYGDTAKKAAENHRKDLIDTLDYLRQNLPRTLVSVVVTPHMDIIRNFTARSLLCELVNDLECPCMFGLRFDNRRQELSRVMDDWQKVDEQVSADSRYAGLKDFAVVTQPFTKSLIFPNITTEAGHRTDYSFLSQDCFHFSQKGMARAANALWNNMMEPVGRKSEDWDDTFSRFLCPTEERPYIYTSGNSGV
ncbi:phospholipase B1, membrane-associated-like [Schistocerca americana]|uniref:phospholipase B1, membrane-associated-like n=1 Tax=Schistocerca americana TaxID=7009 RepID=UPI001F4F3005|nr:phospholipase B1, membrane-associated-like [Schistocerca americana]